MKHIVGVADMKIANQMGDIVITHALGSCLGIAVHDPKANIGGILHVMMPMSKINPQKAKVNPYMFVDTGVPAFFDKIYKAGGKKERLIIKVAGGANVQANSNDRFEIGKRNHVILKKLFWKNGILIEAEDVGSNKARTMQLEIGTGCVTLSTAGVTSVL